VHVDARRSGLRRALLGSVTEEVLRHARHPIVLVGPSLDRGAWQLEHWFAEAKLLVAIDGSPASEAVVSDAREWGQMLDLHPLVVEVAPEPIGIRVQRRDDAIPTAEVRQAAEALDSLERPSQHAVLHAVDVAASLLDYARGLPVALIAMGTHGRTGLARVTLGSVAMRVVHGSACPVLVTPSHNLVA
jgi:nucleotide-binding universal stress UspA family protein